MSRSIVKIAWSGKILPKSKFTENVYKDKKPKKSFVYRDENVYTKANGGPGNKRGWKKFMPKWLYKKLKNEFIT